MGSLFSGGGGGGGGGAPAPVIIQAPTPVVPVAPSGPQLAPGQTYPGGPIGAIPAPRAAAVQSGIGEETEDMRRWRRLLGGNTILGAYDGSADGGTAGTGTGNDSSASTGSSADASGDGSGTY